MRLNGYHDALGGNIEGSYGGVIVGDANEYVEVHNAAGLVPVTSKFLSPNIEDLDELVQASANSICLLAKAAIFPLNSRLQFVINYNTLYE